MEKAIKLKIFLSFLWLVTWLIYKNCIFAIEPSYVIDLPPDTKFYVNRNGGISHNTYIIETEDKKLFFKETKRKLSMYDTAKRAIVEYFKDDYKKDQESMLTSLLEENNLNNFIYMKTYGDGMAAKWLNTSDKSDTSVLGLTGNLSDDFKREILPNFLPYAFAEFVQYRANKNREVGEYQLNQLICSLATVRVAKLLDLTDLIVKTEYVKLKVPLEDDKLGIVMECAKGIPFKELKQLTSKSVTPSLQLHLSNLMILDALCAQRDRSVGNYFSVLSKNFDIIGVSAYDNDLAFDSYTDLKSRNFVLPPILNKDGALALPHIDKTLAHKILSLNSDDIHFSLKDLLNDTQIDATISRLCQIQNAIKQSLIENPMFLLDPSEWNDQTMKEELSISNDTYFKYFVNKLQS